MLAWSPMMERRRLRTWISWRRPDVELGEQHGGGHFVHAHGVARDFVLQAVHIQIEAVLLPQLVGTAYSAPWRRRRRWSRRCRLHRRHAFARLWKSNRCDRRYRGDVRPTSCSTR